MTLMSSSGTPNIVLDIHHLSSQPALFADAPRDASVSAGMLRSWDSMHSEHGHFRTAQISGMPCNRTLESSTTPS